MEDPWGSPWATADTASPPKIDLPVAPPSAHFPIENANTTAAVAPPASSPRRSIQQSPWGEEEEDGAWGGWNDGAAAAPAGANSPGWGRSPGLRPVAPSLSSSRGVSPDPWRLSSDERRRSLSVNKRSRSRAGSDAVGDSAISLSRGATPSLNRKPSSLAEKESQNAWLSAQPDKPAILTVDPPTQTPELLKPASTDYVADDLGDDGARSPNGVRSASKVQELVDMYDGIAEQSVSPVEPQFIKPPMRKVSSKGQSLEDVSATAEQDEIGQTEDAQQPTVDIGSPISKITGNEETFEEVQPQSPLAADTISKSIERKPNHTAIKVSVDFSKLDELFPSTPQVNVEAELVPDVIIDDTFSSISERKAWYRLSRQGSMRMHNLGDDENYVRMDWNRSTLRQDTLKIVRRWMEEDSITGRPVMGRKTGVIGASMFNWDTAAPAVQIGELLSKRRGHSRQTSSSSKLSLTSPRVASFEWASPPSSPMSSKAPLSLAGRFKHNEIRSNRPQSVVGPLTETKDSLRPSSFDSMRTDRPKSLIIPPADPVVQPTIDQAMLQPEMTGKDRNNVEAPIRNGDDDNDDDDDWGEMVSSEGLPAAPMPSEPAHKPKLMSSGFETQELHGTPDSTYATVGTNVAPAHKRVTADPWSLDGPDSWTSENKQRNSDTSPLQNTIEPKAATAGSSDLKENGGIPQHDAFAWPSAPLQPMQVVPPTEGNIEAAAAKTSLHTSPTASKPSPSITSPFENSEVVDEETVARILREIPDLSYMLR